MSLTAGLHDIPLAAYCADPAPEASLSASVAHTLLTQSPKHAWVAHPKLNPYYQPEESSRMDIGSIAHAILLEGDRSRVVVVEANDWRTKAAQEKRDDARAHGFLPVLVTQMMDIELMVTAARKAIAQSELAEVFEPDGGKSEQTVIWQEGDIWLRSRPDRLATDHRIVADYKTTQNAEPLTWARGPMLGNGCDLQAALGLRGIEKLTGGRAAFVFIVQETTDPFAVSFVSLSPAYLEFAKAKLERAIYTWGTCLANNSWPSYPSQIVYAEPPVWAMQEEME